MAFSGLAVSRYGVDGEILHQDADNEVASFWHQLFDAVFGCAGSRAGGCWESWT